VVNSKFPLGRLVATPGALRVLSSAQVAELVTRHAQGDAGDMPPEDQEANAHALIDGARIMSSYTILGEGEAPGRREIWIITEADRAVTTVLLPDEY
jgi:hypothetical protein